MWTTLTNALALVVSAVVVHVAYLGYVRPQAAQVLEAARQAGQSAPRDLVVILKDYEQEICLILMLWGMFLIVSKCVLPIRSTAGGRSCWGSWRWAYCWAPAC